MIKFDSSYINTIIEKNFIICIGVFAIIPFLVISIYNNPSADDFCYNIISQKYGYWQANLFAYNNWNGRYLTSFILTIKSFVSDSFIVYKFIPIVLFSLLFFSIYYVFAIFFERIEKRYILTFGFFIMTMYLIQMPSISQGFYWLPSSISYQLSNILSVTFFYFLLKFIKEKKTKHLLISCLIVGYVIGCNETSMLLINFLIVTIFVYISINNKKVEKSFLILLIFVITYSIIVFIAPGNSARSSVFSNNHQFVYSVLNSFIDFKKYILYWLPFIIIFVLYYFNNFSLIKDSFYSKLFNVNPFVVFITVFSIPIIGFFPGYWSLGGPPPLRVINTIYFFFLMGFMYFTFVLYFYLKEKEVTFIKFSNWVNYLIVLLILIKLTSNNNIKTAYADLFSGQAYHYDLELKKRYQLIDQASQNTVKVSKLKNEPKTIFFDDITSDSEDWRNDCYDNYFNREITIENAK